LICAGLLALNSADSYAQGCQIPDSVRGMIPADAPPAVPYETRWVTGADGASVRLGLGHLHYSDQNPIVDLPPGADDWLQRVILPLSAAPGAAPFAWIAGGWILTDGATPRPLARGGLIETGYEEPSFVVLETRPDGWLRLGYAWVDGDFGTAWTQSCSLSDGPVALEFTEWSTWLLSETISPLFYRAESPGELRSAPSFGATSLREIAGDYILEPLEIRGEWMKVTVKEPSDYCAFELEPSRREGWVRWYSPERGPLLWYFTRGC